MVPEYLEYWGFSKHPFSLSPDPAMLYLGSQHQEALMRLKYGVASNKGGVLLISENAGDGKTTVLKRLMEELNEDYAGQIKIAFIDHPTLTVNQMIAEIARQLGVTRVRKEKIDNLNALRVKLGELHETGMKSLVIVDEGQMLVHKPDILQELRILLNFCVSDTFLLSFIFSGQKPLEGAIKRMPEFWQRLPVRFFLKNLDVRDTGDLIRFRVRAAGQFERELFTQTAIEGVHRFSQGIPRVICSIADLALLVGFSQRSQKIDFSEISQATTDMSKSGELFHYFSFMETQKSGKRASKARHCASCGTRVKARETNCPHCGVLLAPPESAGAQAERAEECPSCLRQVTGDTTRCAHCGYYIFHPCPRCQHRNKVDGSTGCARCGYPLPDRESLATRALEEGLRSLGIKAAPQGLDRRFPELSSEGRLHIGWAAPRLTWWGDRAALEAGGRKIEGSFFITDRSLLFINGNEKRRIAYNQIRNVGVSIGERNGATVRPRLSVALESEELSIGFPVHTDKPVQLAAMLSDYLTNKRPAT